MVGASETNKSIAPSGFTLSNSCNECSGTTDDTIQINIPAFLGAFVDEVPIAAMTSHLNQNKCFLAFQVPTGTLGSLAYIDIELPDATNYLGQSFILFIDPTVNFGLNNTSNSVVGFNVRSNTSPIYTFSSTTFASTDDVQFRALDNSAALAPLAPGSVNCVQAFELHGIEEGWYLCRNQMLLCKN